MSNLDNIQRRKNCSGFGIVRVVTTAEAGIQYDAKTSGYPAFAGYDYLIWTAMNSTTFS